MPYMYIIFPQLNATSIYVKFGLVDCVFIWLLLFIWALCSWSKISVFIHHFWQPCTCISPLYLTLIYYIGQILEELYYVDLCLEDTAFIQDWGNALFVKAYSFHCHMAHLGKKKGEHVCFHIAIQVHFYRHFWKQLPNSYILAEQKPQPLFESFLLNFVLNRSLIWIRIHCKVEF